MKTKKTLSKRVKITKTGKILHRRVTISHLRRKESSSRRQRKKRMKEAEKSNVKKIKQLLPYA